MSNSSVLHSAMMNEINVSFQQKRSKKWEILRENFEQHANFDFLKVDLEICTYIFIYIQTCISIRQAIKQSILVPAAAAYDGAAQGGGEGAEQRQQLSLSTSIIPTAAGEGEGAAASHTQTTDHRNSDASHDQVYMRLIV